ncbi:Glycosyl transferase family 2 [Sphingobacterium nematocida]|uniref:Glycosyl transferase family 2 n=1 Tax=Sphingobacterium nematocida TaxID=1513896 RepID=A0A1T5EY03_9SPHI|nr:glycosyltransferase [Sphingobacterium nematocida]SKB88833.1 Glycosyl transferase family 2 [Sphingobacterium nematocida]
MKKISVCLPSYNGELYIKAQLESILMQLSSDDEIIVSDDTSIDRTVEIIESIGDQRVILHKGNSFKSPIYNLENALKKSNGDIIILADQDDFWLPGRVDLISQMLQKCDLVMTDAFIVDKFLNKTGTTVFEVLKTDVGFLSNLVKNKFVGCCMAFNKDVKEKVLPFPRNLPMHDQWIALIAHLYFDIRFVTTPTLLYRRHDSNTSNTGEKSSNSIYVKLLFRVRIFIAIVIHFFSKKKFN